MNRMASRFADAMLTVFNQFFKFLIDGQEIIMPRLLSLKHQVTNTGLKWELFQSLRFDVAQRFRCLSPNGGRHSNRH
jgi:hypothetical protein